MPELVIVPKVPVKVYVAAKSRIPLEFVIVIVPLTTNDPLAVNVCAVVNVKLL